MNYTSTYMADLSKITSVVPNLEEIRHKSILITGSTGLVCSAIVDFLININDACNMDLTIYIAARSRNKAEQRFSSYLDRSDVRFIKYDALKEVDWDFSTDYIIHGASPANPTVYVKKPVETMLTNILGINNILDYTRHHNVKKVLFISSSEVYGKKDDLAPYGEEEYGYVDILNPRACYPSAKRACETLCASYNQEYGVEFVTVRLGHVYGPTATRQDSRASSQFFYDVIDDHDIVMKSAGLQMRSYCYVIDCVSAIITILINGQGNKSYNVSNVGSIVSIRELAETIAIKSGKRVIYEVPSSFESKGYNLMSNSSLTSNRLEELGWKGLFNIETGVEHTISILRGE